LTYPSRSRKAVALLGHSEEAILPKASGRRGSQLGGGHLVGNAAGSSPCDSILD